MKQEMIDEVLTYPGFAVYTGEKKDELLKILHETNLFPAQLDLLFNSNSVSGGFIANLVEESAQIGHEANQAAKKLGKFIWNMKEKKHESFPPEPIIKTAIDRLGPCGEKEIEDIQKLITSYVVVHKGKIIQAPLTQSDVIHTPPSASSAYLISASSTLFSSESTDSHNKHDLISALTLLRLSGIDNSENQAMLKKNQEHLAGIIQVLDNLCQLEIGSQANFDKLMQLITPTDPQKQSLARLGFALDRLVEGKLLTPQNGQLYFEKLVENVAEPSGHKFLQLLSKYEQEIKSNPALLKKNK